MVCNQSKKLQLVCSLLIFFTIVAMCLGGAGCSSDQAAEPSGWHEAPRRPPSEEPLPPNTGLLARETDLSHLTGQKMPERLLVVGQALPDSWDWRAQGKVTPVKDQNPCGACYAFALIGNIESKLLIDGAGSYDFSENNAKECNWPELNNYIDSSGRPWGSCNGGTSWDVASLFSQKGLVLESCDPFVPSDVDCRGTCPYQITLLDWRMICSGVVPNTDVLKSYIQTYGPVSTSMYADEAEGFMSYDGSYTVNYWTSPEAAPNHGVLIVGWSNNLPPVPGGTGPADGWIVKNSWGPDWGDNGYFYITYGSANIGMDSSFMYDWQHYDSKGGIMYYDDDGWSREGGYGDTTGWGLVMFFPASDTYITRVEFWTTDKTTDIDVYIYDNFDGTTLSNKLWESLDHSFNEAGYHGVTVDPPLAVSSGDDVIAVVKFTNEGYLLPIPIDDIGPHETGRTYISPDGTTWEDTGSYEADIAIRLRTSGAPAANNPPNAPSTPSPANHAAGVSTSADLRWTGGDPDAGHAVTYDVYFGTSATPPLVSDDQWGTTYDPGTLAYNTTYYWQIIATDDHAASTPGPLWDFTTSTSGQPDITAFPTSFDVTLPSNRIQNYTLTIGNTGGATLTYSISDKQTAGEATAAEERQGSFSMKPASMVLEVPLESSPVEPESIGEAQSGWQNIMTDGFEGTFPGVWEVWAEHSATDAYWGKDGYRYATGSYSVFCAKSGIAGVNPPVDYPNNMEAWMIYGPFSLADAGDAEMNFQCWVDTEYSYDYFSWWASVDGTNFYPGSGLTGNTGGWVSKTFDLTDVPGLGNLCGQAQVWIAFIFESNESNTGKGAFIDDVVLRKYAGAINNPPNSPSSPSPSNHATGVSIDADLSWIGGDPDAGDTVTYDVYFGTSSTPPLVSNDQSGTAYDPGTLANNTTYYWQIVATDNHAGLTTGPVWDFTTVMAGDCPWLDENPKSGTVEPGNSDSMTVTIDTTGVTNGDYSAEIVISSNDIGEPGVTVPVALHVVPCDLTITSTAGGTVTTPGVGTFTYDGGTVVNLVATPSTGYRFVNWTGNVGTIADVNDATTTVTMNGDYSVKANFEAIPRDLSVNSTEGGSVTSPGEGTFTYDEGTSVDLEAEPEEGYRFVNWIGDVGTVADVNAASTTITVNDDYSITATFGPAGGACFIATAAYGTDTARELDVLREFRDEVLLPNALGAEFVSFYYETSPPIADFISQHDILRTAVRVGFVDLIVAILDWGHDL
jgi:C1A family cysteine protease